VKEHPLGRLSQEMVDSSPLVMWDPLEVRPIVRISAVSSALVEVAYELSMQRRMLLHTRRVRELEPKELQSTVLTALVVNVLSSLHQLESDASFMMSLTEIDLASNILRALESK
jgi:hypothetical protein